MNDTLKLEICSQDLDNLDAVLKRLKENNPDLDFKVEMVDEKDNLDS